MTRETRLTLGGLSRSELVESLASHGVLLNSHAETLLADASFDRPSEEREVVVRELTVANLGLHNGASLAQVFLTAQDHGLVLCSLDTAPYLRLALLAQQSAPDAVMSSGSAPSSSITVSADPISDDEEFPKGFYLRAVDGQLWLRGYRCGSDHLWSPDDVFAFEVPS